MEKADFTGIQVHTTGMMNGTIRGAARTCFVARCGEIEEHEMQWKGLMLALLLAPLAGHAGPARFDHYLLALSVAPAFCGGDKAGTFCRLPPLHLPANIRARLGQVMPGAADCLDRYQWAKHGSCSGLAEADYFAASVALTERVNRAIGREITNHVGREVDLAGLRATLARVDPALKDAVVFDCQTPRTPDPAKRRPMLREGRVDFEG